MFAKIALLCFVLLGIALVASVEEGTAGKTPENPAAVGRIILVKNCSRCHAFGNGPV